MTILNPIRLFNRNGPYYMATLQFEEPVKVNGVSIILAEWGGYLAMAPKMKDGNDNWKSVIKWKTSYAHKLANKAVEADNYNKRETPVKLANDRSIIGYATLELPCSVDVAVFIDKHGTPYLRLPGRTVTFMNDGKECKRTIYYIDIEDRNKREEIAKQIIEAAKKHK